MFASWSFQWGTKMKKSSCRCKPFVICKIDGCAAARAIRHCGKADAETIPILAITANAFDDDRQKSLSAGMNDYLSKPLDIHKLTEAIQKFRTTPTDSGGLVG